MTAWPKAILAAYAVVAFVVAVRLDRDESRRNKAGEAALERHSQAEEKWSRVLLDENHGQALPEDLRLELDRLRVTIDILGWHAVSAMAEPEVKHALEALLADPAPTIAGAQGAMAAAISDRGMADRLDHTLEQAPLSALLWRDNTGGMIPWAEANLHGALMQDIVTRPEYRPKPSSLGALKPSVAQALQGWCFADMQRLEQKVCTPPDPESLLPPIQALEDDEIPAQGAILWAAATLKSQILEAWVMDGSKSDESRRRAALAYTRATPKTESIARLKTWLNMKAPAYMPLLAALELLRLGAYQDVGSIRKVAAQEHGVEALTLNWIADVLDGKIKER